MAIIKSAVLHVPTTHFKLRAYQDFPGHQIKLVALFCRVGDGPVEKRALVQDPGEPFPSFQLVPVGEAQPVPPLFVFPENDSAAQELMDDLWACGVRPTEGRGSAGQLDAVRHHLEDMRKLVFEMIAVPSRPSSK